jgi:hypothetical protein
LRELRKAPKIIGRRQRFAGPQAVVEIESRQLGKRDGNIRTRLGQPRIERWPLAGQELLFEPVAELINSGGKNSGIPGSRHNAPYTADGLPD